MADMNPIIEGSSELGIFRKVGSRARSTFVQRVNWLVVRPKLLSKQHGGASKALIRSMRLDGLVSGKTYWIDIRLSREIAAAKMIVKSR